MDNNKFSLDFLNNDTFISNARTTIIILFVLGSAAIYWGIYDSFQLGALLDPEISGLGFIGITNLRLTRYEITNRAMEDEYKENQELRSIDENISKEIDKINIDRAIEIINNKNIEGRKKYNILYTQKIIQKLNHKIFKLKVRKKPVKNLIDRIAVLKTEPIQIRWYNLLTPKYKDINIHKFIKKDKNFKGVQMEGSSKYGYNPRSDGKYTSWIFTILNLLGLTTAGAFMFVYNIPLLTVIVYYGFLLMGMAWIIIRRYPKIRLLRKTREITTKNNKLELLRIINGG